MFGRFFGKTIGKAAESAFVAGITVGSFKIAEKKGAHHADAPHKLYNGGKSVESMVLRAYLKENHDKRQSGLRKK